MDVTCDRCHTEYEFDDALVSEQGTSVRCTQCGFKFRVRKQGGGTAPEIWVVRTVDGRELEFRAIRDLKTAISAGRISRDDVLSRGVGRPRRLASIAELEPFFTGHAQLRSATSIGLGDEPRPRSRTPQGLGPPLTEDSSPGRDGSVAIPLPAASQSEVTRQYPRELANDLSKLEDGVLRNVATTQTFGTPSPLSRSRPSDDQPTPAHGTPALSKSSGFRSPSTPGPLEVSPSTERDPVSIEPETARREPAPKGATPAPAKIVSTPAPPEIASSPAAASPAAASSAAASPAAASSAAASSAAASSPAASSAAASSLAASPAAASSPAASPVPGAAPAPLAGASGAREEGAPASVGSVEPASQRQAMVPEASESEPSTQRKQAPSVAAKTTPEPPPPLPKTRDAMGASGPAEGARAGDPTPRPPSEPPPEARPGRESLESIPDLGMRRGSQTPTPSEVRYSMSGEDSNIVSDPRLSSGVASRSSSGATRLIVGVLVAGALAFALVLAVQRFVLKPTTKTELASDQRLAAFLSEGDKALADGDLDAAKEQLDKASALGDSDPRVAKSLARLANTRAEVPWLKLRLLAADDPDRDAAKREYADATDRARKAVERAQGLAAQDPEVIRAVVDQKRLAGDVAGARKLVDKMSPVSSQPETALVLGALDLAEESPPWPSVIDRLSKAAADEGSIGRARALLVYSLAMSGDPKRARTELDRLAALPRPHPLTGALRKFLDRIDKGETPPLRVDDLPSLAGATDAGTAGGGDIPGSTSAALRQALDARSHGDMRRAENLYQSVIDKDPNNSEALAGLASIARAQGATGRAMGLYQRVIDHNPNFVPAIMALADMKWDGGDRGAAAALYARAVELGGGDARAKERSQGGGNATPPPQEGSSSSSTGGATPTPTPTPDPGEGSTGGSATPPPTPPATPTVNPPEEATP